MHGDLILYVICNNREEQEEWISLIQDCKYMLDGTLVIKEFVCVYGVKFPSTAVMN